MYENHTIKIARTNGLSVDEHMIFETCTRGQEFNYNIHLKNVRLFVQVI